ncbi:MAG: helical backbone metal receptor [Phycisphaerales bacterium]|nr:helical backbone metal receptor [Phycisphaerales bacterium]
MRWCADMMGRTVYLPAIPKRIISVVPSQTELLYHLGLDERVIGITKFCVHPRQWHQTKKRLGGTKKLHINSIIALKPDLIIANKEENTQSEIELLASHFPVWISDIKTLDDALEMIISVGKLVNKEIEAENLKQSISRGFATLIPQRKSLRVAYFIWRNPWMTVGNDTFIHDMICRIGWQNVYADQQRYPETSIDELVNLQPECILLSSEPYPFKEKNMLELKAHLPNTSIHLVDGQFFSWYGSRMQIAVDYFIALQSKVYKKNLLHAKCDIFVNEEENAIGIIGSSNFPKKFN